GAGGGGGGGGGGAGAAGAGGGGAGAGGGTFLPQPATASAVVSATTDSVNRTRIIVTLLVEKASLRSARTHAGRAERAGTPGRTSLRLSTARLAVRFVKRLQRKRHRYNWVANDTIGALDHLLRATARAEARHFWFRGFRYFVTPLVRQATAGLGEP